MLTEIKTNETIGALNEIGATVDFVNLPISEDGLKVLERDIKEVVVIKFPKGSTFKIPGVIGTYSETDPLSLFRIPGDPYLLNSLYLLRKECAVPGSSAASSREKADTVIVKANRKYLLPTSKTLYRTESNPIDPNTRGVEYQANCIYFNDGAATILGTHIGGKYVFQILDLPNDELKNTKEYEGYLNLSRTLIGTTLEGKNVTTSGTMREIKDFCIKNEIGVGIIASPTFIQNGVCLTDKEVFSNCMLGDPRHFIREPYKNGVVHMGVITEAIRRGRGEDIYLSIKNKTPIDFEIPEGLRTFLNESNLDFIRSAYAEDRVYGPEFAKSVRIEKGRLFLPCLMPGCYNHILTGINKEGEVYLVVIPGLVNQASGQDGLSLNEITVLSRELLDKYDLVSLFDSCHGRDPGAMTIINEYPHLVSSNEGIAIPFLGTYTNTDKNTNTSSRTLLGI